MIERKTYKGTLNGFFGIFVDNKPDGLELTEEITWYQPDEGKIFVKDGETFDCVIVDQNTKLEDYVEIIAPTQEQE